MDHALSFFAAHAVPILAGVCIPISGFFLWKLRDVLGLSGWKMAVAPFLYVIFGLLSIIVFSIIHDIPSFPHFTLHHQGLIFIFPLLFPLAAKWLNKDWRDVSDALTVSIPGIIAVLRVFCLLNGCCYGKYFPGTETNIPLRETVMAVNLLVCFLLMFWIRHKHPRGIMLPAYMIFYGLFRLLEVSLRFNPDWSNNSGDRLFAVLSLLIGLFLAVWVLELGEADRNMKSEPYKKKKHKKVVRRK